MSNEMERPSTKMAIHAMRAGLRTLADYIGPKCRNAVEVAMASTFLDDSQEGQHHTCGLDMPTGNQCDGCNAAIPVDLKGIHRMSQAGGYSDLMKCQAYRYEQHPEQAEVAQGEVHRALAAYAKEYGRHLVPVGISEHQDQFVRGWMTRAALAQPSPAPELERPEVMAVLVLGGVFDGRELGDNDIVTVNPAIERLQAALVTDGEVLVELMTVAQHERIVGALRAELETERQRLSACGVAALGYYYGCADAYKSASLNDVLTLRAKCEAALAKLAAMEQQEATWQFKSKCEDGWKETSHDHLEALLREGYEIRQVRAPVAQAGQVPDIDTRPTLAYGVRGNRYMVKATRGEIGEPYTDNQIIELVERSPSSHCGKGPDINGMVNRFLCWRLPENFHPDAGIAFTPPSNPAWWPTGTNLFSAEQAKAMFEHCLAAPQPAKGDGSDE